MCFVPFFKLILPNSHIELCPDSAAFALYYSGKACGVGSSSNLEKHVYTKFAVLILPLVLANSALAEPRTVIGATVRVDAIVTGLDEPWAIAFLPDDSMLITERGGRLLQIIGGNVQEIGGLPDVFAEGQGGLLDLVLARDFAMTRELFLTFAEPREGGAGTALAVAKFAESAPALTNLKVIYRMNTTSERDIHFGGRVVEARDGTLMLTNGERGNGDLAQDMNADNGKVIRVNRDGSIPSDNPFVAGILPEIWSLGHRNPQGAALDANGRYWTVEHGAKGGDEINHPEAGKNYGWPIITYGLNYDGNKIGIGTNAPGMEQPAFYWDPSIAPSGMMIYSGKLIPAWAGDIFVGSLKFDMISRLEVSGDKVSEAERLFQDIYPRIRDVREAPDGAIWFLSVGDGAAYRISPIE